jgi:dTDP-4-dehydrorhamnose 3,5-epimerase
MNIKKYNLKKYKDERGFFLETFSKKKFKNQKKFNFVEDDISFSKKNVLRGFHGDFKTWKLITCIYGKAQIGVINFNKKDKDFKFNQYFILNSSNPCQLLIPPGFGVAYLTLSKEVIISYKQSQYYGKNRQFSIKYNSPCINFKWKTNKFILSKRDRMATHLY